MITLFFFFSINQVSIDTIFTINKVVTDTFLQIIKLSLILFESKQMIIDTFFKQLMGHWCILHLTKWSLINQVITDTLYN